MSKAVLDIELTNMPAAVDLDSHYDGAFFLLRYHGRPVGTVTLPSRHNKIELNEHRDKIETAVDACVKYAVLDHYLFGDTRPAPQHDFRATIAVCTRNRTDDLKLCLQALMKVPDRGQEILIVDNNPSSNDTRDLVMQYPSVRYVLENRKGLDIARNRAIAEASNDIVVFTDDDALPDPGWLDAILRHFAEPLTMCVTGLTLPLELETKAQEAFEHYNSFSKGFFRKTYSLSNRHPLSTGGIGAGANMALRKSFMEHTGWFDEALDAGTATQSGGDHEFFARVLLSGYQIVYEPEALSWHRHRRTWKEAVSAIKGYGIGVYAFWTKLLVVDRQYSILSFPGGWLFHVQLPNFYKSLLGIKKYPVEFMLAEWEGCLKGPFAYFRSVKRLRQQPKMQAE